MKAARKCGPTRGMRSIGFLSVRLRNPLRNPLQNRSEQQISPVPPIEPENVLVKVGLQEFGTHVVVDAADPALHQTPESFDALGMNIARDINLCAVADALVDITLRLQTIVGREIIGENCTARQDIFLRQAVKSFPCRIRSHTRHDAARASCGAAFGYSYNCNLVTSERWTALPTLSPSLSAVVHLIHLHRRTLQLQTVLGQEAPNLAEHAPRGLVGDACFPLNLLRGDSAASGTHEIHRVKPQPQGSSSFLKDCSGQWVDVIAA